MKHKKDFEECLIQWLGIVVILMIITMICVLIYITKGIALLIIGGVLSILIIPAWICYKWSNRK